MRIQKTLTFRIFNHCASSLRTGCVGVLCSLLLKATRSFTLPPGFKYCIVHNSIYTCCGHVSRSSNLCFSQYLHAKRVAQGVDSHKRRIAYKPLFQQINDHIASYTPMSPVTPETVSSLRSSIGRGSNRLCNRLCLRCCT